ncbi:hypothetical protein ILUMI_12380 [Ignelater luminosus]|uniref:Uncharacterized protein n=1 Tax=Ignelater luminosus TaxID=2038154 RepID=A0A8K0CYA4_IGNLU|nr:hypothetical protein ILUMI_12380 [Ignelater luminosus]
MECEKHKRGEVEIIEEMKERNVSILEVTETKRKGTGSQMLEGGYTKYIWWSGVDNSTRAEAGVTNITCKAVTDKAIDVKMVTERIITTAVKIESEAHTLIVGYGPNDGN